MRIKILSLYDEKQITSDIYDSLLGLIFLI